MALSWESSGPEPQAADAAAWRRGGSARAPESADGDLSEFAEAEVAVVGHGSAFDSEASQKEKRRAA